MTLDRQAQCPSCGAPMTFKFGGARAQVCRFCRFVVARTDRGLVAQGKMAELLEIPSPFVVGTGGSWGAQRFEIEGRAQYDRVGVAGAPWQEILVGFPEDGTSGWIASAQGRWYLTREARPIGVPPFEVLRPGSSVELREYGGWVVQEVGQRRLLSAEGNLTGIPKPGVVTWFADLSAPNGGFGTIDYGDGSEPPVLFVGQQFDPAGIRFDSGASVEPPSAQVKDVQCPSCGGNLPLVSERTERVVCQYCGTQSDLRAGVLAALGPAPRPPIAPLIPIGARGALRGVEFTCCGFVIRSCVVDGERFPWREYLLWGGPSKGYAWLIEEDARWSLVTPVETGEVTDAGSSASLRGGTYTWKQQVDAVVDYVIGEFYWKVEIGERVDATEFESGRVKLSRERSDTEVTYSLGEPLDPAELTSFGIAPPAGRAAEASGTTEWPSLSKAVVWVLVVVVLCSVALLDDCDGGGGFHGGSGVFSK